MNSPSMDITAGRTTDPASEIVQRLTAIWEKLLNVNPIEPNQNYFDLGGDSSLAVHLFSEIEKVFSIKLPLATLFEAQTIAELAEIIRRQQPAKASSPVAVPAVDETTKTLTGIWQRLLGVDHIEPNQNYFDLGGDSSLAVHLFAEVEKVLGVKLPLATLFDAQTVEQLAEVIRRQAPAATASGWSPLVPIQTGGTRPQLFFFHGAGGELLIYRDLARSLGSDQPIYGLQALGLEGNCPPLTRVEDMVALYLKEIRRVQPHGPYFLAGYCGGGTVAYEAAQQLQAAGEPVGMLALFDTFNWSKIGFHTPWTKLTYGTERLIFHMANVFSLDSEGRRKFLGEKTEQLRNRIPVWKGIILSKFSRKSNHSGSKSFLMGQIWQANDRANVGYVPKPYPGRIIDIRPKKQYRMFNREEFKWGELALGGQETIILPVYPAGMLLEPFVKYLAAAVKEAMDRAIQTSSSGAPSAKVAAE